MNRIILAGFLLTALMLVIEFDVSDALRCRACHKRRQFCKRPKNCRGGLTRGICGCCKRCAKVEHEKCGGIWNIHGRCDHGLVCTIKNKSYFNRFRRAGICVRKHRQPVSPRVCGPICMIYCPFGNVLDGRGCPTCSCKGRSDKFDELP